MKKIIVISILIFLCLSVNAQKYQGTKPQTSIKPTRTKPLFLGEANLKKDLVGLRELREIYNRLISKKAGGVYNYGFYIDTLGKAVLSHPEKHVDMALLNDYVENVFVKYKWIPSHKLGCKVCKVKSSASFKVFFQTDIGKIVIQLRVIEENGSIVFSQVIKN